MGVPTVYWGADQSGDTFVYTSITSGCGVSQTQSWLMKNSSTDTNASQLSMYYLSIAGSGDIVTNSLNTIVSGGTIDFVTGNMTRMVDTETVAIPGSLESAGGNDFTWYENILGTGGLDGKAPLTYRWGKVLNYTYA